MADLAPNSSWCVSIPCTLVFDFLLEQSSFSSFDGIHGPLVRVPLVLIWSFPLEHAEANDKQHVMAPVEDWHPAIQTNDKWIFKLCNNSK